MLWKAQPYKHYQIGDKRTNKGFLFLPKTIDGITRWLEYAEWEEKKTGNGYSSPEWTDTKWLDLNKENFPQLA